MVFNAVQFAAYTQAKDFVRQGKEMTLANYWQAGALTGAVIAFVESPIDLFKTQLQTQVFKAQPKFTTFPGTVSHIFRNHGLRGCFQGLAPTICRNVPAVAGYFGAYESARLGLLAPGQKLDDLESWKLLTAGSLGGFAYWAVTYPIDVIKVRTREDGEGVFDVHALVCSHPFACFLACLQSAMQSDSVVPSERRFRSTADAARQLYKEGGIPRFFKGIAPCLLRAAPANATCFFLYQKSIQWLTQK